MFTEHLAHLSGHTSADALENLKQNIKYEHVCGPVSGRSLM